MSSVVYNNCFPKMAFSPKAYELFQKLSYEKQCRRIQKIKDNYWFNPDNILIVFYFMLGHTARPNKNIDKIFINDIINTNYDIRHVFKGIGHLFINNSKLSIPYNLDHGEFIYSLVNLSEFHERWIFYHKWDSYVKTITDGVDILIKLDKIHLPCNISNVFSYINSKNT